jgi:hypothetical protein
MSLPNDIKNRLPEMLAIERVARALEKTADVRQEAVIKYEKSDFPIYSFSIGSRDPSAPTLGIFGGVHGLERIGTEVVLAWMQNLVELSLWDESLQQRLQKTRLIFMPLVNPVGMYLRRRSNGNHVDLMRNAPIDADEEPAFLLGGQRISTLLPWFRGHASSQEQMEEESQAVCRFVQREMFSSSRAMTVDVHSGFGAVDRLWFPYAKRKSPPPHLPEIMALKKLFDQSYPYHVYRLEPQAKQYTTHGDFWDYLYDLHQAKNIKDDMQKIGAGPLDVSPKPAFYLPWTLELGSWSWLKKNPIQFFSSLGPFNPVQPHRLRRTLRRHITLFDFLHRALIGSNQWLELDATTRQAMERRALELWYDKTKA